MKKLVLMFVAIAAVSFASCGNKAADAEKATADSIRIADSIAADGIRTLTPDIPVLSEEDPPGWEVRQPLAGIQIGP